MKKKKQKIKSRGVGYFVLGSSGIAEFSFNFAGMKEKIMRKMTVAEAQTLCLERNIPFYSYRLPGNTEFYFGAQLSGSIEKFESISQCGEASGFIAVPFQESERIPSLFIREELGFWNETEESEVIRRLEGTKGNERAEELTLESVGRQSYHQQVTAMLDILKKGIIRKMVLSRKYKVVTEGYCQAPLWFESLADKYPEAFVFLVSVPGVMTYMGATPEIFLEQTVQGARTMALAGTRPVGVVGEWGEKEMEEQAIVAEYIAGLLNDNGNWAVKGPFTKKAGKVEHLCTTFTSEKYLSTQEVERLRHSLHPTPAVGGFPAIPAIQMIRQIEGENRRYYAGYVGPVNQDATFHWYVNLRSMELFQHAVCLYIGGGITALSDPEKEWEETELKSRTLLDIVNMHN